MIAANTYMTEKSFNTLLLLQRLIFAAAFAFLAAGEALHINAFTQNAIDIGLPMARPLCIAIVALTFICAACIALGFFFRTACFGMTVVTFLSGFFFFAGSVNKVNMMGVLFALTILCGFFFMGPGKISLAYWAAQQRIKNNKRIAFR